MAKLMRKSPMIVAAIFLLVQVWGLADYSAAHFDQSSARGWLFALALETAIFVTWYWTRQSVTRKDGNQDQKDLNTRRGALVAALLFMIASGILNTLKATTGLVPAWSGAFVGALIYGIVPTLFASVLGFLQGNIDRLPFVQAKPATHPLRMRVYALASAWLTLIETRTNAAMQAPEKKPAPQRANRCKKCGKPMTGNAGSHWVWDCPKNPDKRKRKTK
jgi:hypothetical protein